MMNSFKIKNQSQLSQQMGHLVSMMDYARYTTLQAVKGLTLEELDYVQDEESNSIGALLYHIAAVEFGFQIGFFEKRKPNKAEADEWGAAYDLGDKGRKEIKEKPLEFYIEKLNQVRERTLNEFKKLDDDWLYEEVLWEAHPSNHYFIWFHIFEDEINHRGQIRWLRRRLPKELRARK